MACVSSGFGQGAAAIGGNARKLMIFLHEILQVVMLMNKCINIRQVMPWVLIGLAVLVVAFN